MKALLFAFLLVAPLLIFAAPAQAQTDNCEMYEVLKVTGVIDASTIQVCTIGPKEFGEVGDVVNFAVHVQVPATTATTITITPGTTSGCTLGTPVTRTWGNAGNGASYLVGATTTDTTCRTSFQVQVQAGVALLTVLNADYPFNSFCTCTESINAAVSGGMTVSDDEDGWSTFTQAVTLSQNGWRFVDLPPLHVIPYQGPTAVTVPVTFQAYRDDAPPATATMTVTNVDATYSVPASTCTWSSGSSTFEPFSGATGAIAYATSAMTMNADAESCTVRIRVSISEGAGVQAVRYYTLRFVRENNDINNLVQDDANGWSVDIADDTTDDGQLTIPVGEFMVGNQTVTFPDEFTANVAFPGDTANPSVDFWLKTIFWIILLGFFIYQAWWFAAAFAIPGLLDALFPTQIPDDLGLYLVLCLLGVVLEVAAHRFSFAHWRTRNTPTGT